MKNKVYIYESYKKNGNLSKFNTSNIDKVKKELLKKWIVV